LYKRSRLERSEFFETTHVSEQFAKDAPRLFGGGVERGRRPGLEQVESRHEVVRTAAVLQARNELQQHSVDAVTEARLLPVGIERVLLELVQDEGPDVVVVDRAAREIKVAVAQGLEHAETAATAASSKQQRFRLQQNSSTTSSAKICKEQRSYGFVIAL